MRQFSLISLLIAAIATVFLFSLLNPFVQIGTGERGIVLNFGAYSGEIMQPGLRWRWPIMQSVVQMDVQTQKAETDVSAASSDLQSVRTTVALNYHLDPAKVGELYQKLGRDFEGRVIAPAVQEAVKSVTARFTAEELITQRQQVKEDTRIVITDRLARDFITVEDLSIVDFRFSDSFDKSIEAKVTAEQDALAAKNKLEQVKFEAQQKIETAKADAESIRIQAQALAQNQELVKLKAVEKWDGKLPTYMLGESVPFVDLK
jgi:regulator of protease activity HflC (stomatin/prohibitin superfamily)